MMCAVRALYSEQAPGSRGAFSDRGTAVPLPPGDAHQIEHGDRQLLDPKHEEKRASYTGSIYRFLQ